MIFSRYGNVISKKSHWFSRGVMSYHSLSFLAFCFMFNASVGSQKLFGYQRTQSFIYLEPYQAVMLWVTERSKWLLFSRCFFFQIRWIHRHRYASNSVESETQVCVKYSGVIDTGRHQMHSIYRHTFASNRVESDTQVCSHIRWIHTYCFAQNTAHSEVHIRVKYCRVIGTRLRQIQWINKYMFASKTCDSYTQVSIKYIGIIDKGMHQTQWIHRQGKASNTFEL